MKVLMRIKFTVDGSPKGWQRTGYNHITGAKYTQEQTRTQEALVAWAYKKACGAYRFPKGTYVDMRVIAYLPIPKSTSKKNRQLMIDGVIRPTVKPDWDNIGKLIADALNKVAYDDDKCIVDSQVRKFYSEHPRTVVILQEATQ